MMTVHDGGAVGYFGVFDGHSGEKCSAWLAEKLPKTLKALPETGVPAEEMENICQNLDEEFLKIPLNDGDGGSTAIFCSVFKSGRAQVVNVGDSRCLHCRAGKVLFATQDHKPGDPKEEARIVGCGGSVSNKRIDGDLAVSRAFGDVDFKRQARVNYRDQRVIAIPDVTDISWRVGDVLILACDGVFEGNFENEEVCEYVFNQLSTEEGMKDLAVVAARVCDEAVRRKSKDNISCMIVVLRSSSNFVPQYGASSFLPGPPFLRNNEDSRAAYKRMASLGGMTMAEALEKRYELFHAEESGTLQSKPPIMRIAFEMSDDIEKETERSFFGRGPAPGNTKAYFEALCSPPI